MKNIAVKVNGVDVLDADEFNPNQEELENSVTESGQTLSEANESQLGEAMGRYGSGGADFYQDSGSVNAYILTGVGPFIKPTVYFDGMSVKFYTANTNIGPSTIKVDDKSVKDLVSDDGSALVGEEITDEELIIASYNLDSDQFRLNSFHLHSAFENELFHVQDQKPTSTASGTFTDGAERTRDLNTVLTNDIAGASLSSNQITLPAGKYYIEAHAPVVFVENHRAKLRNITTAADLLIGMSSDADNDGFNTGVSSIYGQFVLAGTHIIEVQHRCELTRTNNGFGAVSDFAPFEVYTDVRIWRIS